MAYISIQLRTVLIRASVQRPYTMGAVRHSLGFLLLVLGLSAYSIEAQIFTSNETFEAFHTDKPLLKGIIANWMTFSC